MLRKLTLFMLALPLFLSLQAGAQTVDELIKKNIDAHGGLEKMKAVKTRKMSGKATFPGGVESPFAISQKRPNMIRIEFTMQGMTGVQAYDSKEGWQVMPFMGVKDPQKMSADDLKDIVEQGDFDGPLVDYKDKGNTVELVGKEDVEGSEANKLKLTLKSGDVRYVYLDPETGLELKVTAIIKREGVERSIDTMMGDYKTIEGLTFPMSIEQKMKEQQGPVFTIEKIEMNTEMDDSIFHMPAASPQSAPSKQ